MNTRELTIFKFNGRVIRMVPGAGGMILYCINDICAALGVGNVADVIRRLQSQDIENIDNPTYKGIDNNAPLYGAISWISSQTVGGVQRMAYTDEVGLYDIISKSRKPLAKVFYRRLIQAVPAMRQKIAVTETAPALNLDLASIKALAQTIIGVTGHIEDIHIDLTSLKNDVALLKSGQEVKALLPVVPPLTRRNEIILFINKYMAKYPCEFNEFENIWNHLYDAFRLRTRRDIKREARHSGYMSVLAYVQSVGEIDRLWVVARDLYDK